MPTTTRKIEPGDVLAERELRTITGEPVRLPHPERLTHLQFRRYATCPLCNLHLRSIAQRHDEILAAGIREFGVEATPRALLNPRVWPTAIRAAIHNRRLVPATPNGGILGLPADFLIDTNNHVLDRKYGTHAYDQWTVDELLAHAR